MDDAADTANPEEGDLVLLDRRPDGVALVTLNRPKMNALSSDVLERLRAVLAELAADPPGAVVVWGGRRLFSAGADVTEFADKEGPARIGASLHGITHALEIFPRVTIAAISGFALGGGLELALGCDLRVASAEARLGQPEILLGIIPGGGATQRLPRLIGPSRAKDLVLTGRHVHADEALTMGLVDRVVPAGTALEGALELAAQLAQGPHAAQAMAKRAIDEGMERTLSDGLRHELFLFSSVFETQDAATGVASFLEQGPGHARFVGH